MALEVKNRYCQNPSRAMSGTHKVFGVFSYLAGKKYKVYKP